MQFPRHARSCHIIFSLLFTSLKEQRLHSAVHAAVDLISFQTCISATYNTYGDYICL